MPVRSNPTADRSSQGSFALTFDTELIWGSFDHTAPAAFAARYRDIRGTILAILRLLERYEIPATWAIVGHLFLRECRRDGSGIAHPELVHPKQAWFGRDWYESDPCANRDTHPLWYGDDILDVLQAASTPQEIGCHSFAHALFDDPLLTPEAVRSDLEACLALAERRGITLRSFVFPRNRQGHHDQLRRYGFSAFRGPDPTWHARFPGTSARVAHLVDQAAAIRPPVSVPREYLPGLWNIPGSMVLLERSGVRRVIPVSATVRKARLGLQRAADDGGVFHLWTHPFNLASEPELMLRMLDEVLRYAVRLRNAGSIRFETMGAIAERMAGTRGLDHG